MILLKVVFTQNNYHRSCSAARLQKDELLMSELTIMFLYTISKLPPLRNSSLIKTCSANKTIIFFLIIQSQQHLILFYVTDDLVLAVEQKRIRQLRPLLLGILLTL